MYLATTALPEQMLYVKKKGFWVKTKEFGRNGETKVRTIWKHDVNKKYRENYTEQNESPTRKDEDWKID